MTIDHHVVILMRAIVFRWFENLALFSFRRNGRSVGIWWMHLRTRSFKAVFEQRLYGGNTGGDDAEILFQDCSDCNTAELVWYNALVSETWRCSAQRSDLQVTSVFTSFRSTVRVMFMPVAMRPRLINPHIATFFRVLIWIFHKIRIGEREIPRSRTAFTAVTG